jgi:hypothetical protein
VEEASAGESGGSSVGSDHHHSPKKPAFVVVPPKAWSARRMVRSAKPRSIASSVTTAAARGPAARAWRSHAAAFSISSARARRLAGSLPERVAEDSPLDDWPLDEWPLENWPGAGFQVTAGAASGPRESIV